jgi:beta-glucanase (GH16 family)
VNNSLKKTIGERLSMKRRRLRFFIPAILCVLIFLPRAHASSLLSNPGFESSPLTLNGWTGYGGNALVQNNSALAHSGTNFFKVYQNFSGAVNFTGIYQDYISGAGAVYSANGWAYNNSGDALAGQNIAWIEISFRDASANVLALYRSTTISTNLIGTAAFPRNSWINLPVTNQYNSGSFQITNTTTQLIAPAGTYFVRYQIVFQGDALYSGGSLYFDDLTLTQTGGNAYGNWNITWSDEFNSNSINPKTWTYDTGSGGWGNQELEYYTSRPQNAYATNGCLHIVAQKEAYDGASYTSARMKTQGLFSFTGGRVEWRAQLPAGTGFWPALWLLGTNISTSIGWPGCGEIDVMENNGSKLNMVQGSLHSGSDETAIYTFLNSDSVTNFHTYTLDWATNAILFYIDGHLYESQTSWSSSYGAYPTPFNQPFFIIMNIAVGGNYVNNPTTAAINTNGGFPGQMLVDYVRIYNQTNPLKLSISQTNSSLILNWPTNIVCHLQSQTNELSAGTNWLDLISASNSTQIQPTSSATFYRLASP